jgi:transposase
VALARYLTDPMQPVDNKWVENRIRPIGLGRSNWLFAGSLRVGKLAAAIVSLIQTLYIPTSPG